MSVTLHIQFLHFDAKGADKDNNNNNANEKLFKTLLGIFLIEITFNCHYYSHFNYFKKYLFIKFVRTIYVF